MFPDDALDAPEHLRSVNIDWSELETVRSRLPEFKELAYLTLINVGGAELPPELAKLPLLKSAKLLVAGERLPPGMQVFSSLRELTLRVMHATPAQSSGPALAELPETLRRFSQLELLRIEGAGFDQFPAVVYDLVGLQMLDLHGGRIDHFPVGISRLKNLRRISWSQVALAALPADLGKLPALQAMQLDRLAWPGISVEPDDFVALESLALRNCELSTLPDELALLPRLRHLDVSGNPLMQIPSALASARKLESLNAEGSRLECFPGELFSLPALKRIDLTGNTFPKDEYESLERLANSHPTIEVLMPRNSAKIPAPGATISLKPLAKSIQKDLDRLGVQADKPDLRLREEPIAGMTWPVPPALGELLGRISSARAMSAPSPTGDDKPARLDLAYQPGALNEHECIHHHPYVVVASTETYFYVVIRLDDQKPEDPMLYVIDSEDFKVHEAGKLGRLSDWLKEAHPVGRKSSRAKTSARARGAAGTSKKKRRRRT